MDEVPIAATPVRDQRGFTLIELMIVVAVIAVLAIVVVPQFFRESSRTRSITEVAPMFAEISAKEEQFKNDTGAYGDLATCPSAPSLSGTATSSCTSATTWAAMHMSPSLEKLRCSYTVTSGTASDTANPVSGFTFTSPTTTGWYYIEAECDGDNDSSVNGKFFATSVNSTIQKTNEEK